MPTYVYRFVDTGETIEVQQSFDEPTLTEAPHPGDGQPRPVKKVFTPVGITFKGNGFYKTDSRGVEERLVVDRHEVHGLLVLAVALVGLRLLGLVELLDVVYAD